jgi:hypothetical protein
MGPPSARRKRANGDQMRPAAGPIPGSAIPSRLINPAGFDKAKPGPFSGIDDSDRRWRRIRDLRGYLPSFLKAGYHLFSCDNRNGGLQFDRNVAIEAARRAIIPVNPTIRKSPAATAGLFNFQRQR